MTRLDKTRLHHLRTHPAQFQLQPEHVGSLEGPNNVRNKKNEIKLRVEAFRLDKRAGNEQQEIGHLPTVTSEPINRLKLKPTGSGIKCKGIYPNTQSKIFNAL